MRHLGIFQAMLVRCGVLFAIAFAQWATPAGAQPAIAAGRFAEFHAATKAGWDRGGLPPHSNSISGGLDATPSADAQ
jgi:hypothetical protein